MSYLLPLIAYLYRKTIFWIISNRIYSSEKSGQEENWAIKKGAIAPFNIGLVFNEDFA